MSGITSACDLAHPVVAAAGPPQRESGPYHFTSGDSKEIRYSSGLYRPADTTGGVCLNGVNFTPEASMESELGHGRGIIILKDGG